MLVTSKKFLCTALYLIKFHNFEINDLISEQLEVFKTLLALIKDNDHRINYTLKLDCLNIKMFTILTECCILTTVNPGHAHVMRF